MLVKSFTVVYRNSRYWDLGCLAKLSIWSFSTRNRPPERRNHLHVVPRVEKHYSEMFKTVSKGSGMILKRKIIKTPSKSNEIPLRSGSGSLRRPESDFGEIFKISTFSILV